MKKSRGWLMLLALFLKGDGLPRESHRLRASRGRIGCPVLELD